jgi:hypothetical protein
MAVVRAGPGVDAANCLSESPDANYRAIAKINIGRAEYLQCTACAPGPAGGCGPRRRLTWARPDAGLLRAGPGARALEEPSVY